MNTNGRRGAGARGPGGRRGQPPRAGAVVVPAVPERPAGGTTWQTLERLGVR